MCTVRHVFNGRFYLALQIRVRGCPDGLVAVSQVSLVHIAFRYQKLKKDESIVSSGFFQCTEPATMHGCEQPFSKEERLHAAIQCTFFVSSSSSSFHILLMSMAVGMIRNRWVRVSKVQPKGEVETELPCLKKSRNLWFKIL